MLTLLSGLLVGLALGLTGGGGSIIAVPLLIFVMGVAPALATTMSLASVSVMAAFGAAQAGRNKMIEYKASFILAAGGIVLAPLGVRFSKFVSDQFLLSGFGILMLLIAASMWFKASKKPEQAAVVRVNYAADPDTDGPICRLNENKTLRLSTPCGGALVIIGCLTGLLSGFFGVGGGFLIVPALTFISQLNMHRAIASSLLIIALIGCSGVISAFMQGRDIDLAVTGLFTLGGLLGMLVGRSLVKKIPGAILQKGFVVCIVLVALLTFYLNT